MNTDDTKKKVKGDKNMATMVKPGNGIFEFTVKKSCLSKLLEEVNKTTVSKEYIEDCKRISMELRKNK